MIRSKKHLSSILNNSWDHLCELTNKIDKYYYKKEEIKKDKLGNPKLDKKGKLRIRVIYPSKGELKAIQDKINKRIFRYVEMSASAYGGIKGKDNVYNSRKHLGKKYKFVTDLKDCFPSINSGLVYLSLIKNGFSPDVASMITKLTTYKNQVPQGARTSSYVCNIVMQSLDKRLLELCIANNITYTRYIDDLTFSSQTDFKYLTSQILEIIKSESFKLSHDKTGYVIGSTMITGNRVSNNRLDISDELKEKLSNPDKYTEKQIRGQHQYANRVLGSI